MWVRIMLAEFFFGRLAEFPSEIHKHYRNEVSKVQSGQDRIKIQGHTWIIITRKMDISDYHRCRDAVVLLDIQTKQMLVSPFLGSLEKLSIVNWIFRCHFSMKKEGEGGILVLMTLGL